MAEAKGGGGGRRAEEGFPSLAGQPPGGGLTAPPPAGQPRGATWRQPGGAEADPSPMCPPLLVTTSVDTLRLLVANTSRCGDKSEGAFTQPLQWLTCGSDSLSITPTSSLLVHKQPPQ
jgi:hypothetical protein